MIREISVIIIYCIWVMMFHYQNEKRIEDKNRELEKRINDLEKTVYIVPRD